VTWGGHITHRRVMSHRFGRVVGSSYVENGRDMGGWGGTKFHNHSSYVTLTLPMSHTLALSMSNCYLSCNTLQHTATHCNTLQHTATHCNTLQHITTHCNTLQHTATHHDTLQQTAAHCKNTATRCDALRHAATRCNILVTH